MTGQGGRRIETVALVGRDADLWLSALAVQRAVGRTGVRIEAVELPSRLGPEDVYTGLPSLSGLHRLLGLEEAALYALCSAVPSLGQRFEHWSGEGSHFLHAYDIQRPAIQDIDFLQFWVKARHEGLRVPLEDFSLAAAAAKQGRIDDRPGGPESLSGFVPGVHVDARAYAGLLRKAATSSGIASRGAEAVSVERAGERIQAVRLADGSRIEADLFVDASGADAVLIGGLPGAERTSWAQWMPCDRLLRASAPVLRPLPAFANISAFSAGWVGLYPLQGRTAVVGAFASNALSDAEAISTAAAAAGTRFVGDPVVTPLAPGALGRPWIGNCVAVGEAAAAIEAVDAGALHILQVGLSNLVALWPVTAERMPEAALYNEAVGAHLANLRDFTAAHYLLSGRAGEPFWEAVRAAPPTPGLAPKLSLFASRGKVLLYDDETFQAQNWSAIFAGHGLLPRSYDPLVDTIPVEEQMAMFRALLGTIAAEVKAMPDVAAFIAERSRPRR